MKVIAYCWSCQKEYDISKEPYDAKDKKCECGGYIITPSGKTYSKLIPETQAEKVMLGLIER